MEIWAEIRRRVLVDGLSKRAACREYSIHWDTLKKILEHAEPPGYRRAVPRPRPKLDSFLPVIHQILEDDKKAPRKRGRMPCRGVGAMRMTHDLRGHHRTRSVRVEVRSVQLGGEATGRITVTCDGQTRQFDTRRLAGVFVQAGGGDGTVRVDIQGEDEAP